MRIVIDAFRVADGDRAEEGTGDAAYRRKRRSEDSAAGDEGRDRCSGGLRGAAAIVELKIDVPVRAADCGRVDSDAVNNAGARRHDRTEQQSRQGDEAFWGRYEASQAWTRDGKTRPSSGPIGFFNVLAAHVCKHSQIRRMGANCDPRCELINHLWVFHRGATATYA